MKDEKKEHKNLDDLNYNEIQEVCKGLNLSPKGKVDYLKKIIRAEWVTLKVTELPPTKKTEHKNLDDMKEEQVFALAEELEIKTTGKKLDRVKQEIRVTWANKGVVELPAVGLIVKKKSKDVMRRENHNFTYEFNDEEMTQKAMQLANAQGDKEQLENEKKSAMSSFADKINAKQAEISILSRNVREGQEMVNKTCDVKYDFAKGEKIYTFDKKIVDRVRMTTNDYQLDVEFPEEKAKA